MDEDQGSGGQKESFHPLGKDNSFNRLAEGKKHNGINQKRAKQRFHNFILTEGFRRCQTDEDGDDRQGQNGAPRRERDAGDLRRPNPLAG